MADKRKAEGTLVSRPKVKPAEVSSSQPLSEFARHQTQNRSQLSGRQSTPRQSQRQTIPFQSSFRQSQLHSFDLPSFRSQSHISDLPSIRSQPQIIESQLLSLDRLQSTPIQWTSTRYRSISKSYGAQLRRSLSSPLLHPDGSFLGLPFRPWPYIRSNTLGKLPGHKESKEESATERHCETGEVSSAPKSPPEDSVQIEGGDLIEQIKKIIKQDERLGRCLLYLSIFPENSHISCRRVARLWTAEGFLGNGANYNPQRAESCLQNLRGGKWILPRETRIDGGLSTFQVDNRVRQNLVSLSDQLNLVIITREGSINWPEKVGRLSVQGTVKDLNEEKLSQLRSLFVFDVSSNKDKTKVFEASPSETSENQLFPSNVKLLKVLDLTGSSLQIAPDALFESTLLRYLSFRDTSIEEIPGSIGKLKHLEFLDAKHSLVTELPKEVEGLKKIRQILIYHYEKDLMMRSYDLIGFRPLCSFGGFECLEKLCFVEADDSIWEDLGKLTKLRRLGITKLRRGHRRSLCSSLEKLGKLESLNIHAFDKYETIDLPQLDSPPKNLKRLYLHSRLKKLPDWISSLDGLTKILLRWSRLEEDLLATLGQLPNLLELELRLAYDGEQLDFKNGQFRRLEILLLDELEGLRSMSLQKGTMPCLENLTISRCQWLEGIPSGIEHIRAKKLTFFDMSREFYEKIRADHEKDGYKKFKHIPEVYFTQWRASHWETHQGESTDEASSSDQGESDDEVSHQVECTDEAHYSQSGKKH